MIKQIIRLVRPYSFLPVFRLELLQEGKVLVKPTVMSICAADQRYFQGNRPKEVLARKLPMSLIHEALGEVIDDDSGVLKPGQQVIMLPGGREYNNAQSNYEKNAFFRSSNEDGFCQETLYLSHEELIVIPEREDTECYVFAELMSVCCHAIRRIAEIKQLSGAQRIGVWGDGAMGFMMALVAKELYPDHHVTVFGKHEEKLMLFSFVDQIINILGDRGLPEVDVAFECVGGQGAVLAIEQIIASIKSCGSTVLMGVSEVPPVINTRMILEKGLLFLGTSRSQRKDFETAKKLIDSPKIYGALEKLISSRVNVHSYLDLHDAFVTDMQNPFRTVLHVSF